MQRVNCQIADLSKGLQFRSDSEDLKNCETHILSQLDFLAEELSEKCLGFESSFKKSQEVCEKIVDSQKDLILKYDRIKSELRYNVQ